MEVPRLWYVATQKWVCSQRATSLSCWAFMSLLPASAINDVSRWSVPFTTDMNETHALNHKCSAF